MTAGACSPPVFGVPREVALDAKGLAEPIVVEQGPGGVAVRVTAATGTHACVQIEQLVDGDGVEQVAPHDDGPYCRECAERVAVGVGWGLFVLPSGANPLAGPLTIRVMARDCATFTGSPPTEESPPSLFVETMALPSTPATGRLTLRVAVTPGSRFYADPAAAVPELAETVLALSEHLAAAGIAVEATQCWLPAATIADTDDAPGDLSSLGALQAEVTQACGPAPGSLTVVLAGCVRQSALLGGVVSEPQATTTHVGAGMGPPDLADGIFVRGRLCGYSPSVFVPWSPAGLGKLLAHEVGHALGLYHSIESDGSTDLLSDTASDNLMNYRPTLATSAGLTWMQSEVMRRHPLVRSADCP